MELITKKPMPETLEEKFTRADRDAILEVKINTANLIKTVDEIRNNTLSKVERLAVEKANQKDVEEQNKRIDSLENYRSWVVGLGTAIGVIIALVVYIYFSDLNHIKSELDRHVEITK